MNIEKQDVIYSIAKIRNGGKTVDWGHPELEHVKGIVVINKNVKSENELANASKATVIERENEISNKMIRTVVKGKF